MVAGPWLTPTKLCLARRTTAGRSGEAVSEGTWPLVDSWTGFHSLWSQSSSPGEKRAFVGRRGEHCAWSSQGALCHPDLGLSEGSWGKCSWLLAWGDCPRQHIRPRLPALCSGETHSSCRSLGLLAQGEAGPERSTEHGDLGVVPCSSGASQCPAFPLLPEGLAQRLQPKA